MTDHPWSASVRVDDVPVEGRHVALEAGPEIRAALAKPVGVVAIDRLVARFDVTRRGRDGFRVAGEVSATVRQSCVVTLEPVSNEINEPIEVDFAPPRADKLKDVSEIEIDSEAEDEAEPLTGNSIDLGLLATEFLILGVDPYPRKVDADFTAPAVDDAAANPFAALAALKKNDTAKE
jgi:uncharacterized metal-binding protein YceD (DUF177 family)